MFLDFIHLYVFEQAITCTKSTHINKMCLKKNEQNRQTSYTHPKRQQTNKEISKLPYLIHRKEIAARFQKTVRLMF